MLGKERVSTTANFFAEGGSQGQVGTFLWTGRCMHGMMQCLCES